MFLKHLNYLYFLLSLFYLSNPDTRDFASKLLTVGNKFRILINIF